jgi:polyisoprenoid-binding protein YceI
METRVARRLAGCHGRRPAIPLVTAAFALAALQASAEPVKLSIDAQHSSVAFRVRHLLTKVSGQFRAFEGTIEFDAKNPAASKVSVTIRADSIDTNVEARDKDLRSARFFDVAKHPTLSFTSAAIADATPSRGRVKGLLTMRGVSREVVLDAEFLGSAKDPWGNLRYAFHAETRINRKEFGMTWNEVIEAGGVLVGDEVEIVLDVEAVPAK